nr:response regulator transcription factor [uncultured Blautia sp.]
MKKIAVVEDDNSLRTALAGVLEENGYTPCLILDFMKADREILAAEADLVLLDIILPGTSGQEILRNLRKNSQIPVIMLTSKNEEMDEILAMSYGADDYMTKPYNPTLLLLKIEAIFRRMTPDQTSTELEYKGMRVDLLRSTMKYQEQETVLSKNEITILYYLMKNQGKIVSRDELMDYLWDCNDFVDDNTLTVNINRLRKRLEKAGLPGVIETRRRQGYLLV